MSRGLSILLVGGYGAVGTEAAQTIRGRHPRAHLTIAGRDGAKAAALARSLGNAESIECDLATPGLGLTQEGRYRAVAVFAKDDYLHGLDLAVDHGAAYAAVSEYAVEIAPLVARSVGDAQGIPILMLSHHLGGLVTLVALHYAREFAAVGAVRIGALFDPDDLGGATAEADAARVARAAPYPQVRDQGRWTWAEEAKVSRQFYDAAGDLHTGTGLSLLDVASVAAATRALSVRFDVAVRAPADGADSRHEVVIEIEGCRAGHLTETSRIVIRDDAHHTRMSGRTMAFALERLLGLDGHPAPQPSLLLPETILNPATIVQLAQASGIGIDVQRQPI